MISFSCQEENSTFEKENEVQNSLKQNPMPHNPIANKGVITRDNIQNKKVMEASDGVVFLFDKKETHYKNVITILPHSLKERKALVSFLKEDKISFVYTLEAIRFSNSKNERLTFVVNNKQGREFYKNLNTDEKIYFCDQIAYAKDNTFVFGKFEKDAIKIKANSLVKNMASVNTDTFLNKGIDDDDCTSGGEGSTSCTIGDIYSNCSVSCGDGYYACCDGGSNVCDCRPEDKDTGLE